MEIKLTIKKYDILLYLILIPFLYPRGFQEYVNAYKMFFTIWLYLAIVLIVLIFSFNVVRRTLTVKKSTWTMLIYAVTYIIITLCVQGGISNGYQKLFAAPALCMICSLTMDNYCDSLIRCMSNIIMVNFLLNITIFSPMLWSQYFSADDSHIIFLGHVQLCAQIGILGVFLAYLENFAGKKIKSGCLLVLSLLTMIMSKTFASYMTIAVLFFAFIIRKRIRNLVLNPNILMGGFLFTNIGLFVVVQKCVSGKLNYMLTALTSGRTYVWRAVLDLMKGHWICGYGAYGALIKVFWSAWASNSVGMNYAHNELLQRVLDGGIILLVLFIIMFYNYIKSIKRGDNEKINYWCYVFVIAIMILMIFETVTEYFYIYILLTCFSYLSIIETQLECIRKRGKK